jgi:DNA-binding CsgD family transcriptional regulator
LRSQIPRPMQQPDVAEKQNPCMEGIQSVLSEIIGAIGEGDFPSRAATALCRFTSFELAAVILHRNPCSSSVLFDNFEQIGCRPGLETYVLTTHRINPILGSARHGAVRASDYGGQRSEITEPLRSYLVEAPEEELGFRTIGWPVRHEEIGLHFEGWGGLIEFGLYRERGRKAASARILRALGLLSRPVAAAFERHQTLSLLCPQRDLTSPASAWRASLTAREREVCELLLAGCSSDAIALRLSLSRYTVKDHRKNIFRKLRIASLAELFALARLSLVRGNDVPLPGADNPTA